MNKKRHDLKDEIQDAVTIRRPIGDFPYSVENMLISSIQGVEWGAIEAINMTKTKEISVRIM